MLATDCIVSTCREYAPASKADCSSRVAGSSGQVEVGNKCRRESCEIVYSVAWSRKPSRKRLSQISRSWRVVVDCIDVVNPRAICLSKQDAYTETDTRDFPVMDSIRLRHSNFIHDMKTRVIRLNKDNFGMELTTRDPRD